MIDSPPRRFRVGAVLGRSIKTLWANITPFWTLAMLVTSPMLAYGLFFDPSDGITDFEAVVGNTMAIAWPLMVQLVIAVVAYGAFQELRGQRAGTGECIRRGLSCIGPALVVAVVQVIMFVAIGLFLGLFVVLFSAGWVPFGQLFSTLVFFAILTVAYIAFWVTIPVAAIERPGLFNCFRRSLALTKGHRWRIFGLLLVLMLALLVLGVGIVVFFGGALMALVPVVDITTGAMPANPAWLTLLGHGVNALAFAFYGVIIVVGYHDLRITKEGVLAEDVVAVFD